LLDYRISQVTPLDRGVDALDLIEASARRNVAKARRVPVDVERDARELHTLAALHRQNIEAVGGRPKTLSFFEALPRHMVEGSQFDVWIARMHGEVAAGLLVLYFNETVEYFTPAIAHDHRSDQPLAAVLAVAMRAAVDAGYRRWNWGGTWQSQSGVHRFKRKWGARDGRYDYWIQLNDAGLLDLSPADVRDRYGDFYVVPFSELRVEGGQLWAARS
jgi:hypothetical protein